MDLWYVHDLNLNTDKQMEAGPLVYEMRLERGKDMRGRDPECDRLLSIQPTRQHQLRKSNRESSPALHTGC